MNDQVNYVIGTSGYSFGDWVGMFYPPDTRRQDMFSHYTQVFPTVELNFTYYRMPTPRTLEALARKSPDGFAFWVKANREITHAGNASIIDEFVGNLAPLRETGKLAGVLMQFPQSFHRTIETRKFLAGSVETFGTTPLAVEFRHCSWQDASVAEGLRERNVTLVVPDCPAIRSLYHSPAAATTRTGYLRLHSRDADKWYAPDADRYDYTYREAELKEIAREWAELAAETDQVYAFFNNCHGGQAAANAEAFRRIVEEM